jgi:hypothetical protein
VTAPCPAQAPPPDPTAAEPDGRRVLSRGGVADHEVTPQAPLTGSGCREHSYSGFGGRHPPSARIPAAITATSPLCYNSGATSYSWSNFNCRYGRDESALITKGYLTKG